MHFLYDIHCKFVVFDAKYSSFKNTTHHTTTTTSGLRSTEFPKTSRSQKHRQPNLTSGGSPSKQMTLSNTQTSKLRFHKGTTAQEHQRPRTWAGLSSKTSKRMKRYCSNCQAAKCRAGTRSSRQRSVAERRTGCPSSENEGI